MNSSIDIFTNHHFGDALWAARSDTPNDATMESYLNKMTLAEKVGQMAQVGIDDFVFIGNKEENDKIN